MEATRAGRTAISLLVVFFVSAALLGSFRPRLIDRRLRALGFQQSWDVFAPDPIHREVIFEAVIVYADGTESTWRVPRASSWFPLPSHPLELWQDPMLSDAPAPPWGQ